jgi:DNA topoisomerase-1
MATPSKPSRPRLRRSDCSSPGLRRVRRGRGFSLQGADGKRIDDPETVERIHALAIPPAWQDVWICADPWGHLQATGIDDAGRKQYLYHARWRERRDEAKFQRMESFARSLPKLRRKIARAVADGEPTREAVLACAVRLLDVGLFRVGSEQYAEDDHGIGLATVRREHVRAEGDSLLFDYPGKGGVRRLHEIHDPLVTGIVDKLRRRRGGPPELLAFRTGRRWSPVRSDDINEYLKSLIGEDYSAKDFRTWNATVLAAVSLATDPPGATKTSRKRGATRAVKAVSGMLGNTPAVARRSYIDPRVFDRYDSGWTIGAALDRIDKLDPGIDKDRAKLERAVLDLLADNEESPALEHADAA